ncbi:MAG: hypothetical protein LBN36_03675 [Clostridiales Family XIII bacterium]|jgi:hypothetical protein|nr:hypothetical protein [Clostridiales Family XIII bacterium]
MNFAQFYYNLEMARWNRNKAFRTTCVVHFFVLIAFEAVVGLISMHATGKPHLISMEIAVITVSLSALNEMRRARKNYKKEVASIEHNYHAFELPCK